MYSKHKLVEHRARGHTESGKTGGCVGGTSSNFRLLLLWFLPTVHSGWNSAHLPTPLLRILPHTLAEAKVTLLQPSSPLELRM